MIYSFCQQFGYNKIMRLAYRSLRRFGLDHSKLSENITKEGERNYCVSKNENINGFLVNNKSDHTVIMIHEWWGFNNSIINTAEYFADLSKKNNTLLNVFIPDLYRGAPAKDAEDAEHKMNHLDWKKALSDIGSVKGHFVGNGHKVSIMGFCMGGALTFASLSYYKGFKAGAVFYGIPDLKQFPIQKIDAKVIAHFGREDPLKGFSDIEMAKKIKELSGQHNKNNIKVEIHDGVGHAFCNQDSKYFNREARERAFKLTSQYFKI